MAKGKDAYDLLEELADIRESIAEAKADQTEKEKKIIGPAVLKKLEDSRKGYKKDLSTLESRAKKAEDAAKTAVVDMGESVKAARLEGRFNNGRTSWNADYLEALATEHPAILKAKTVGDPFCAIYAVKQES